MRKINSTVRYAWMIAFQCLYPSYSTKICVIFLLTIVSNSQRITQPPSTERVLPVI